MVIMNIYQIIASEYRELFPSSLLKVDFTMRYVRPHEESSILDIGCASGEFLCQLASSGRKLSGIDIDSAMIAEASAFAAENILFLQADMTGYLQKSKESEYDLITCFGNTVVYLKDEDALNTFFNGALKALKKGGRIIIQVLNYGRKDIGEGFTFEPLESGRLRFDRFYSLNKDGEHLDFHTSVTDKITGEVFTDTHVLYPFASTTIADRARQAGFSNVERFGSYDNDAACESDFFHLIVAEK